MDLKTLVLTVVALSLLLTVFSFGLQTTRDDVLYLFNRPGLLVRSLMAMFVVVPIATIAIVRTFDAPRTVEIVLIALALSPVPPVFPKKMHKIHSTSGYGIGLLATASLLSIAIIPLGMHLMGRYFDRPIAMPEMKIFTLVFRNILVPLVAGLALRQLAPDLASRIHRPIEIIGTVLLTAGALALIAASLPAMWRLADARTVLVIAAFVLIGLAAGHLLGGPGIEYESVLATSSASRHPGIALALASANFPDERFAATILLYLLVSAVVCIPYIRWERAKRVVPA